MWLVWQSRNIATITLNTTKNLPLNVVLDITGLKRMDTVLKYMDKFESVHDYAGILEQKTVEPVEVSFW